MQETQSTHLFHHVTFRGEGNFTACRAKLYPLLNIPTTCPRSPCSMNGVFQPPINYYNQVAIVVAVYSISSRYIVVASRYIVAIVRELRSSIEICSVRASESRLIYIMYNLSSCKLPNY